MEIFLDLEETVIDSWQSGLLINATAVREFLKARNAKSVHIFSFAIWHDSDVWEFRKRLCRPLERALDISVAQILSAEQMMMIDTEKTNLHHDSITDFVALRGKIGAFMSWCGHRFPDQHCVLVDDVVPNATWKNHDTMLTCEFVNIETVKKQLYAI